MNIYFEELEFTQEMSDAQQQVNKDIDYIVDSSFKEMAHWKEEVENKIPAHAQRFNELEFKMDMRAAADRAKKSIENLLAVNERYARWSERILNITSTSLDSREVCLKYDLKPSELLQHEKDGLESFEEDGEKRFQLEDLIDYFED